MKQVNNNNNAAIITSSYLPVQGGIQYLLYWLLVELDKNYEEYISSFGIDSLSLICPYYEDNSYTSFRNIKVFTFDAIKSKKGIFKNIKSVRGIVKENDINLLHAQHAMSDGILALFSGTEYILTSHGIDFAHDKRFNYGDRLSSIKSFIVRMVAKRAKMITTVSSPMIDYVNEIVPKNKIRLIENCYSNMDESFEDELIEKEVLSIKKEYDISSRDTVYLTLSGARKIKGHHNMILAFKKALEVNQDLKLFIAAHGEESKNLKSLVSELGVEKNVNFINFITGVKKAAFFKLADAYVNTAFFEPFGLVYLESIQFDMAVLGSMKGGAVDIFEHKKSAYLIEPDKIDEIKEGYLYLVKKTNREKLKTNASYLLERYTPKSIISKYLKLYGELLDG